MHSMVSAEDGWASGANGTLLHYGADEHHLIWAPVMLAQQQP